MTALHLARQSLRAAWRHALLAARVVREWRKR
jgi:hypothetical protein